MIWVKSLRNNSVAIYAYKHVRHMSHFGCLSFTRVLPYPLIISRKQVRVWGGLLGVF